MLCTYKNHDGSFISLFAQCSQHWNRFVSVYMQYKSTTFSGEIMLHIAMGRRREIRKPKECRGPGIDYGWTKLFS